MTNIMTRQIGEIMEKELIEKLDSLCTNALLDSTECSKRGVGARKEAKGAITEGQLEDEKAQIYWNFYVLLEEILKHKKGSMYYEKVR